VSAGKAIGSRQRGCEEWLGPLAVKLYFQNHFEQLRAGQSEESQKRKIATTSEE
jgi:hypothetical protein